MKLAGLLVASVTATLAPSAADACTPVIDSYKKLNTTNPEHVNQCAWAGGTCFIDLKGVKYANANPNAPVIIYNHGSGMEVKASGDKSAACAIADFFVPLGYTVYAPVRRGHYASIGTSNYYSSGKFVSDNYSGAAEVDELVRQRYDVQAAIVHVKTFNGGTATKYAIMGSSYGGMVSLFTNTMLLDQKAVVAFAPGSISWMGDNDAGDDSDGDGDFTNDPDVPNTYLQNLLKQQVTLGKSALFLIQAKWCHDTRVTTELSMALANSNIVGGAEHQRDYQAAIFDWGYPNDPQLTHVEFPRRTDLWGETVLAYLKRMGVKP